MRVSLFFTAFKNLPFIIVLIFVVFLFTGCPESTSPSKSASSGLSFLMAYDGGGDLGDDPGIVMVNSKGSVSWVSNYYPFYQSTDFVDMKNGRIAMAVKNYPEPHDSISPIAYMDINDITNVKFIPVPKAADPDYYWSVPTMRPQVMTDGRIIFKVVYETDNPYDDYHDGQLAIYDPKTGEYEFSGSLSGFILDQPEQGPDTEGGSMGGSFALSPDETFVCISAYGYGTDAGVYHEDYFFIAKYDLEQHHYSRVAVGGSTIFFVSSDNNYVIADMDGVKQRFDVNNADTKFKLDDNTGSICVGQYARKSGLFFKIWRGSGMSLFNVNAGWLYNPILGDSLKYPYRGLGQGGQFSEDESKIYFTATTDFYTNYKSPFVVYSTPVSLGKTDTDPDSLFTMPLEYNKNLFLLLHK